jgi:hypothetical protein
VIEVTEKSLNNSTIIITEMPIISTNKMIDIEAETSIREITKEIIIKKVAIRTITIKIIKEISETKTLVEKIETTETTTITIEETEVEASMIETKINLK